MINYINKFGANGYKGLDPIGELFYECLNYYKDRGPTNEFAAALMTIGTAAFTVRDIARIGIPHTILDGYFPRPG